MNFEQRFDVHAVGQGFFYSGSAIYRNYSKFNFVFDCGSENKDEARREIRDYRSEVFTVRKRLNLLVISHFDADHVNLVNELLVNDIKVDKLVMPFTLFEERLFLFLEGVVTTNGYNIGDELTYRFTLDPVGELRNNLDGDSEIYVVENDPDSIPPAGADNIINDDFRGSGNAEQIVIDFPVRAVLSSGEYAATGIPGNYNTYLVRDNQKAVVNIGRAVLMEFLFYKKSIGTKDKDFFKAVADEFFKASGIDRTATDRVDQVVSYIARNYRSATPVKELFATAKKTADLGRIAVSDLNKTALCLIHRNVERKAPVKNYSFNCFQVNHFSAHTEPILSQPSYFPPLFNILPFWLGATVMLTSDGFLKAPTDLKAFQDKYVNYLNECWLVQVPHHGSQKNITQDFFGVFSLYSEYFINYGTMNRHGHPDKEVFETKLDAYHFSPLLVNEHQGLRWLISSNIE